MKGKSLKLLLFLLFLPFLLKAVVITRDDVISKAETYLNLNWSPSIDTCVIKDWQGNKINGTFKSYYKKGQKYTWEAYVWGGINTPSQFMNRINNNYCAGGYNTSSYGYYYPGQDSSGSAASHFLAGIDCAAFVNDCLYQTIWQGMNPLIGSSIEIDTLKVKMGDVWRLKKNGQNKHIRLAADGLGDVYESHAERDTIYPGVQYRYVSHANYHSYSIFPQFDYEYPAYGAVEDSGDVDSISVMIYGKGDLTTSNVSMTVNGQIASDTVVIINDTSVLFVSYNNTLFDSLKGEVNVELVARANSINLLRQRRLLVGTVETEGVCLTNMIKSDIWYV